MLAAGNGDVDAGIAGDSRPGGECEGCRWRRHRADLRGACGAGETARLLLTKGADSRRRGQPPLDGADVRRRERASRGGEAATSGPGRATRTSAMAGAGPAAPAQRALRGDAEHHPGAAARRARTPAVKDAGGRHLDHLAWRGATTARWSTCERSRRDDEGSRKLEPPERDRRGLQRGLAGIQQSTATFQKAGAVRLLPPPGGGPAGQPDWRGMRGFPIDTKPWPGEQVERGGGSRSRRAGRCSSKRSRCRNWRRSSRAPRSAT